MAGQVTVDEYTSLFSCARSGAIAGCNRLFRSQRAAHFKTHAALFPDTIQEEFDVALSPSLQQLRIDCDAVDGEARRVPEQKLEEEVGREFGVAHPDLAASGKLLKQNCHAPDPAQ